MPSLYVTVGCAPAGPDTMVPGKLTDACACASDAGKVIGSLPDGSASPQSRAAIAVPNSWPGYHDSITPATLLSHGIRTAPPVLSTTTVRGFAAATAAMSWSWSPGMASELRSLPSPVTSLTKTTATSEPRAACTAWATIAGSGACQPMLSVAGPIAWMAAYSTVMGTGRPAVRSAMPWASVAK